VARTQDRRGSYLSILTPNTCALSCINTGDWKTRRAYGTEKHVVNFDKWFRHVFFVSFKNLVQRTREHDNTRTRKHENTGTREHENTGTREHKNTRTKKTRELEN